MVGASTTASTALTFARRTAITTTLMTTVTAFSVSVAPPPQHPDLLELVEGRETGLFSFIMKTRIDNRCSKSLKRSARMVAGMMELEYAGLIQAFLIWIAPYEVKFSPFLVKDNIKVIISVKVNYVDSHQKKSTK